MQGLVTLEALAADLPVVAVEASGTSDVVTDGVDSLLTENSPEAPAGAIIRVLRDEELRAALLTGVRETVQRYDIRRQVERLTAVYDQAIEDKKADRFVQVDKGKPLLRGPWYELLGLEQNPFRKMSQDITDLMRRV